MPTGGALEVIKGDRAALTARVKEYLNDREEGLKKAHLALTPGIEITRSHTLGVDDILKSLFMSLSGDSTAGDKAALVALGGYGRGELNIRSDIDLMLLYKSRITPGIERLTQDMLYILWDAGLDVGFSIRSPGECIALAREDSKTMTSLLDMRYLLGNNALFAGLEEKVRGSLFTGRALKNFIEEKVEERKARHEKYGGSVYILEPNVKEGEGGLRDIHTAQWVVRAKQEGRFEPLRDGLLSGDEKKAMDDAAGFLHWVRNDLHFASRRKKDQLTFDHQERMAGLMGFRDSDSSLAVESFMQNYYRFASAVKNITSLILSRCLRKKDGAFTFIRKIAAIDGDFVIKGGLLAAAADGVFAKDPASIMRAFEYSQSYEVGMEQRTRDLILANLNLIDDPFRISPAVGESFRNILKGGNVYDTLSEMHQLKVLERYIPEFSAITCRVQHDMYHVYTVDAHSLFAIREIERLKDAYKGEFTVLATLFEEVKDRHVFMLGVLLHDIGKAMGKGHAEKGAAVVPAVCRRIGFSEDETNLAAFLVKNHLILADTAQYRDMHDERLVIEFAKKVGDAERLTLLYLLTFADVRAVGPEVWTQWKGELFRELFFKALTVLDRGAYEVEDAGAKISRTKDAVKALLKGEVEAMAIDDYFGLLPHRYYLANGPEAIAGHIKIVRGLGQNPCVTRVGQVPDRDYTEVVVVTHDMHGLFSMITGVMAANSVNILGAQINTLNNGIALDVLQVKNALGELLTDELKLGKIKKDIEDVVCGKVRVSTLVEKVRPSLLDKKALPSVPTWIEIDNEVSDVFTVVDIHTRDRIGLLYRITSTLARMGLYIGVAKISTRGNEAADIFYIKDIFGQKVYDTELIKKIEKALYDSISAD
ncbi:MAG: [protein-PII] uridylyltransferase [Deltaproteobacteria bacterium]|nr:[protein-PII] uridylyltransferase [Deltaproteobacteria bacterium]